jgi:mannan endo-1,6-alpha-mannosidase
MWKDRVDGLVKASDIFFNNDIMTEIACEKPDSCSTDQKVFKSYLARSMAATITVAPYTQDVLSKKLSTSAQAAAKACVDSADGDDSTTICQLNWSKPAKDSSKVEVGSQMSALQVIQANLVGQASAPATSKSDGSPTDASGTGSPTSTASGSATSTGAASQINAQQILLASPVLSLIFGYFL